MSWFFIVKEFSPPGALSDMAQWMGDLYPGKPFHSASGERLVQRIVSYQILQLPDSFFLFTALAEEGISGKEMLAESFFAKTTNGHVLSDPALEEVVAEIGADGTRYG